MYTFAAPNYFVDSTDLDFESDWNTQYDTPQPLSSSDQSPQSPSCELLYECSFCMTTHSPSAPCDSEAQYTLQLPSNASYSYSEPLYIQDKSSTNTVIESNYRKWLVSVTPR